MTDTRYSTATEDLRNRILNLIPDDSLIPLDRAFGILREIRAVCRDAATFHPAQAAPDSCELTPAQIFLINDMICAWVDREKKGKFREAFRNDCKRLLAAAAPQPASNAGGEPNQSANVHPWTVDGYWEYVGGLAGEFEADQMRDMLAQKGLQIVGINDLAYALPKPGSITDDVVQIACEIYSEVYVDDDKDQGDAMRAALVAALSSMPSTQDGSAA